MTVRLKFAWVRHPRDWKRFSVSTVTAQHRKHLLPCAEIQTGHKSPTAATQSYFNRETVSASLTSSVTLPAITMVHAGTQRQQRRACSPQPAAAGGRWSDATGGWATDPRFVFYHVDRVILNRFVRTSDTEQPSARQAKGRESAAVATIGERAGRAA